MQLLKKFRQSRASRDSPQSLKKCHLLAVPLEIRFMIYQYVAESIFLPRVHYREYIALLLSCKQICKEMKQECLRAAPAILGALQKKIADDSIVKLGPLQPLNFASLNHLTIGIPTWALFSSNALDCALAYAVPVLEMHLSSLTIGLEDLQDEMDFVALNSCSTSGEKAKALAAFDWVRDRGGDEEQNYYNIRTTYANIIKFASKINCFVAPSICDGKHSRYHPRCLRTAYNIPVDKPCNVRKIVLRQRKLHDEVLTPSGRLPRDVYPFNSNWARFIPDEEIHQLWDGGWKLSWYNEKGKVHFHSGRQPVMFVWTVLKDK